jgi:hypothetical protein
LTLAASLGVGTTVSIPPPPPGWSHFDCNVLADGRLLLLRDDVDFYQRLWHRSGDCSMEGAHLRISIFDGQREEFQFEISYPWFPMLDRLPDGRWVLLEWPGTELGRANAAVLGEDGIEINRFVAGGGMRDMACAPDGSIWIAYFDEEYFECETVPGPGGRLYLSSAGLSRFSPEGEILWEYNYDAAGPPNVKSYALCLAGNTAWFCAMPDFGFEGDFPLVRIDGHSATAWHNELRWPTRIAAADDHLLVVGGNGFDGDELIEDRIALVCLAGGRAHIMGKLFLPRPARRPPNTGYTPHGSRTIHGRDDTIHIVEDGQWTRIRVDDAIIRICG